MKPHLRKEMRLIFSLVYLVHFCPFAPIRSVLVYLMINPFGLLQSISSTSVYSVHSVYFSQLGPFQSNSAHFVPFRSTSVYSIHFGPTQSTSFHFRPFGALQSLWCSSVHLSYFGPFKSIFIDIYVKLILKCISYSTYHDRNSLINKFIVLSIL